MLYSLLDIPKEKDLLNFVHAVSFYLKPNEYDNEYLRYLYMNTLNLDVNSQDVIYTTNKQMLQVKQTLANIAK